MSGWKPIELPRSTLEVLADLTVSIVKLHPQTDVAVLWGRLLEETWPLVNPPIQKASETGAASHVWTFGSGYQRMSLDSE
jgi:hypothetical protein